MIHETYEMTDDTRNTAGHSCPSFQVGDDGRCTVCAAQVAESNTRPSGSSILSAPDLREELAEAQAAIVAVRELIYSGGTFKDALDIARQYCAARAIGKEPHGIHLKPGNLLPMRNVLMPGPLPQVNRVEVIDHTGRAYTYWAKDGWGDACKVSASFQDDGRTLKLFIEQPPKPPGPVDPPAPPPRRVA